MSAEVTGPTEDAGIELTSTRAFAAIPSSRRPPRQFVDHRGRIHSPISA